MKLPKLEINEKKVKEIASSYKILELYIFGSALRQDFNDKSDVDLLIKISKDSGYSIFELLEIKEKFEKLFKRKIDLVEMDGLRNPYRKKEILSTARKIYASE
ncbi:MAG TPA: nucleotidyltransferase domain-containing protein [Clostridiales bacterium]|nr:nucleotidyltransferase domain-containing protein [Clostridiales bacterium]HQP69710.1 nucleotidyltransferase domain-containing protein [Clostridiales bacterium]